MAFKKGEAKFLSRDEERALMDDIAVRLDLQHILAEHNETMLEAELGLHPSTVTDIRKDPHWNIEHRTIPNEVAAEARRRVAIWMDANRIMNEGYTLAALAKKYGCSKGTIQNRIRQYRHELNAMRRAA